MGQVPNFFTDKECAKAFTIFESDRSTSKYSQLERVRDSVFFCNGLVLIIIGANSFLNFLKFATHQTVVKAPHASAHGRTRYVLPAI